MPEHLLRPRYVALLVVAFVVMGAAVGSTHSVAAGSDVDVTVAGPGTLTSAATFTAHLSGATDQVCRVQETTTRQSDTTRPFSFPVSLGALPAGEQTLTFQAVSCSNTLLGQVRRQVDVPVRAVANTPYVAPAATDSTERRLTLDVSAQAGPLSAVVTRGGRTVATLPRTDDATATWTWSPRSTTAPGAYTVRITSGAGTVTQPVTVTKGWARLSPTFPRCRTLTWSYDASGQPARAKGMAADVQTAFTRISKATGMKFRKVSGTGTITLGWADLGASGPDGEGGATWTGTTAISGQVQFNTRSTWVGKAGFRIYPGDFPGRGALITHEIGHALGLAHVTDRTQVMYPVASSGSPVGLASGDTAGLDTLYRAKSC